MSPPPPPPLLGPPLIQHLDLSSIAAIEKPKPHTFTNLIDTIFNPSTPNPPRGFTENNSATYLSSGNPSLDFFFQVVPNTPPSRVTSFLASSWKHDPLTALKLVCNLRGVRGTGKSDKEGFYASALWLHENHPRTLALNVGSFAEFGYMKDLLEILYRLIEGPEIRKVKKEEHQAKLQEIKWRKKAKKYKKNMGAVNNRVRGLNLVSETGGGKEKVDEKARAAVSKKMVAVRALRFYTCNEKYKFLHDHVAELFAAMLLSDLEQLKEGSVNNIGLAAKWCPSLDKSYDKTTLICESIARRMWPKGSDPEYKDMEDSHYAYKVRDRLRREVLVPIRKVLELPEVYMSACRWDSLPYNRVASVAMRKYTKIFKKHDDERFGEYLEKVKEGKAKIAAGALLPHEILASIGDPETAQVAELQWQRMVRDLSEKGKLKNCIAVCDVSGSMSGTPMEVCVALGLLLSELSEEPWKGRVITFSAEPKLHKIRGVSLKEKMKFVENMDWGMNTNFQSVFDRILDVAVAGKLEKEKMIKRIFVFSDMEFDRASGLSRCDYYGRQNSANIQWETDYEVICRKFAESGYGSCIPQIVFWNLRDSGSTPVCASQKGVALVSGFSKNLLKIFLDRDGGIDPVAMMEEAISGDEYQKLVVFD